MKRVLDTDPVTGISHLFYADSDSNYRVVVEQDVTPILEANKRKLIDAPTRWGEWTHVASVDLATLMQWRREGKDRDQTFLRRWLNDSDHRDYRTHPGTI
jgi:hypothetical protein